MQEEENSSRNLEHTCLATPVKKFDISERQLNISFLPCHGETSGIM